MSIDHQREMINERKRKWDRENREKVYIYNRRYRHKEKEKAAQSRRTWEAKNKEKHRAHKTIEKLVYTGRIIKPDACQQCGVICVVHGHHEDYSKPKEVIWLCPLCHKEKHPREHGAINS